MWGWSKAEQVPFRSILNPFPCFNVPLCVSSLMSSCDNHTTRGNAIQRDQAIISTCTITVKDIRVWGSGWKRVNYGKDSSKAQLSYRISCRGDRTDLCLDLECSLALWFGEAGSEQKRKRGSGAFPATLLLLQDFKRSQWIQLLDARLGFHSSLDEQAHVTQFSCALGSTSAQEAEFQSVSVRFLFSFSWDFPAWLRLSGVALDLCETWGGSQ